MLEVHSPVPLQEGESIAFGIRTKHVLHFIFGLVISSPFVGILAIVMAVARVPPYEALFLFIPIGVVFSIVRYKDRPLAEFLWLSVRFAMRPKVILYDRTHRIQLHRKASAAQGRD
jgi:hypothetical protein